jgi:hypothetical protein
MVDPIGDIDPPIIATSTSLRLQIRTTLPAELRRHNISDEELEMLMQDSRDGLTEAFWAFVGGFLASLPPTLETITRSFFGEHPEPINIVHLCEIVISAVCFALAVATMFLGRGKSKRIRTLGSEIRARGTQ